MSSPQIDEAFGQFIIRTFQGNNFITARDGGHHSIDALITSATTAGQNDKFNFYLDYPYVCFTTSGQRFVTARSGVNASNQDDQTFQTETFQLVPTAHFRLLGPRQNGTFAIMLPNGNFVTAVDGGGHDTRAFHTDAIAAAALEEFYLLKTGGPGLGKYAIRPTGTGPANSLRFLTANNGGGRTQHAITTSTEVLSDSIFVLVPQPDGSFAIKTPNLHNYVTADDGGGLAHGTPQMDNLITSKTVVQDWEKFRMHETGTGIYTIQTVSGFYIGVKNDFSNISTRISFPDQAPSIGYTAKFELLQTEFS